MPRASLNPDKARQGGGGVEPGNYEVVAPAQFQNIKTDYRPNQLYLVLPAAVLDKDGQRVRGADQVEIQFSFGEKSLEAFHPGKASGPDDTDPEDQTDAADAAGNSIYCVGDEAFNKSCGALVFMESLVKAGFPKQVLDSCYAPSFEGLKFSLDALAPKIINERFGTRLNTKPMADRNNPGQTVDITYKVATKWLNPNYLSTNGKKGGDAAAGTTEAAPETKLTDPEEIAKSVLGRLKAARPGEKNKIKTHQQLVGLFTAEYSKAKLDTKKLAAVQKFVKDQDWLLGALAEVDPEATFDSGVTTFSEA